MAVDEVVNNAISNGNGVARTHSFSPVIISKSSDLVVTKKDINGLETPLFEGATSTTYKVTVSAYPGTGSIDYPATGGTLLQTGESVSMRSVRELTQSNDLENQGGYFADTQETMFDKLTYIAQQQQEQIDRSIKFATTDSAALTKVLPGAAARALKTIMFDESGNVTVGTPTAQTLLGVDETDTDAVKNKLVSNNLALGWERARNQSYGVVRMINTVQSISQDSVSAVWVVYKEDGSVLDVTGTVTDGFQEAIDYAYDYGYDLYVNGGGVQPMVPGVDNNGSLGTNPFTTTISSNVVTVAHTGHGFPSGVEVFFSGVSSPVNGIPSAEFAIRREITVLNANSYSITMTSNATSSGVGGGASVNFKIWGNNVAVMECGGPVFLRAMQNKNIKIGSTTFNFTNGGAGDSCLTIDSSLMFNLDALGCQWVSGDGSYDWIIKVDPTGLIPPDFGDVPTMNVCYLDFGTVNPSHVNTGGICLDASNNSIGGCYFKSAEVAGSGASARGVDIIVGPSKTFDGNRLEFSNIHDFVTTCMRIGTDTNGNNLRGNYINAGVVPSVGGIGAEIWGRNNNIDLNVVDNANLSGDWLKFGSTGMYNNIRLAGTRVFDYTPKITDNSTDKSNAIQAAGKIAASVALTANQTALATGAAWKKVLFNTERYDMGRKFDAATNNRWEPEYIGIATIKASVKWVATVAGSKLGISIFKNGAELHSEHLITHDTSTKQGPNISAEVLIDSASDYFEIFVTQETGVNQDIDGDTNDTWATFTRLF